MPHISRFKRRNDDRTGFRAWEIELVKEGPLKVAGSEWDVPPPSKKSLGGKGDISGEARANSDFSTAGTANILAVNQIRTFYITAADGITPNFEHAFMQVTGSNAAVDITANPQVSAGKEAQVLTLVCVGSDITLDNGTGLNLMGSAQFVMQSGAAIGLIYNTGNTAWSETFRDPTGGRI
mgnify:CR=1 FL=1